MFKQLGIAILVSFVMSTAASAQTAPKAEQQTETSKPKPKPKSNAPEKAKEKPSAKGLHEFFKQGEGQVNDGPNCQPPPDPIV